MDERRLVIESFLSREVTVRSHRTKKKEGPACGDWKVRKVILSSAETIVTMAHPQCVITVVLESAPELSDSRFGSFLDSAELAIIRATSNAGWPTSEDPPTARLRRKGNGQDRGRAYRG